MALIKSFRIIKMILHLKEHVMNQRPVSTYKIPCKPFKLYNLDESPKQETIMTKKEAIDYYKQMLEIRMMETELVSLYLQKKIRGFCHLYIGQEAAAVGIKAAMSAEDHAITAYRAHGWAYVMGVPLHEIIAELLYKKTGNSKGKGGSMHMYWDKFYGGNGIVGAQVPIGGGVAFALKYMNNPGVCVVLYGDGAANQGQVFETFNMAKLWNLPALFICENNQYAMGTSSLRSAANPFLFTRGDLIPGIWVDGMDISTVREGTRFCLNYIKNEKKGPIIMEINTYRYTGHSMSDPDTTYRTRDEINTYRQLHDPIKNFREEILKNNIATKEELEIINKNTKKLIQETARKAEKESEPTVKDDLATHIYVKYIEKSVRNILPFNPIIPK